MPSDHRPPSTKSDAASIAERLIAHARLCRHIAEECWNEETAHKLDALADECVRTAAELAPADRRRMQ